MLRNAASLSAAPTSTWTGLPAAAGAQGQIFRVTDVGVSGVGLMVISDGTRWVPLGPQVLARSSVPASVTGTAAETTLGTVTVPGGVLGVNGGLLVLHSWTTTNNANNKTQFVRYGGAGFYNQAVANVASVGSLTRFRNRNSASSQVGGATANNTVGLGSAATAIGTAAIDSSVDKSLTFSSQLAVGTDTTTLENYEVWLLP